MATKTVKKKQEQVLIGKKATLHVNHTFFVHFFALVLSDYNVELPETSWLHVLWRKCSCRSFSPAASRWPLAASNSHFLTAATKFHVVPTTEKGLLCFFSLVLALFLVQLRWVSPYFLFFSVFLFLCIPKFVDMTINLSLIFKTTRIQKNFPLSVFVFIDSLVVSASQDVSGRTLSRRNKLTFSFGLHELVYTDGRAYTTS